MGMDHFGEFNISTALNFFLKAVKIDSNFVMAQIFVAYSQRYLDYGSIEEQNKWANKVYKRKNELPYFDQVYVEFFMAHIEKRPHDRIRWGKELVRLDPQTWEAWHNIGFAYFRLEQYELAIAPLEQAISLARQWGSQGRIRFSLDMLSACYHKTGDHQRALEILLHNLDNLIETELYYYYVDIAAKYLCIEDTVNANLYMNKYIQLLQNRGSSDAEILAWYGLMYEWADQWDQAEKYYRKALELNPDIFIAKRSLAELLIETKKDESRPA